MTNFVQLVIQSLVIEKEGLVDLPGLHTNKEILPEEQARRQERANRILDAVAELVQRWGYRKTTIDDIAKQAGVAKGTIYLHWKTRNDLFLALLTREYIDILENFRQSVLSDPENVRLHRLLKQVIQIGMSNPLIKAIWVGDTEMLGELARREYSDPSSVTQRRIEFAIRYLELHRSKGLVRTDIDLQTELHMLMAISLGYLMADQFLPDGYTSSLEELAEMAAETVRRTFEPDEPVPVEKVREVQALFLQLLDGLIDAVKERVQKEEA